MTSDDATQFRLYEHRLDKSVMIVARPIWGSDGVVEYECRRYGEEETFVLDSETFLSIYERRHSDGA